MYIPLCIVKRLDLTAIVYVLFLALCVTGVRAWRGALQLASRVPASTQSVAVSEGNAR